jgi:alkylated DNA repair dioxygenase AlkB
MELFQEEFSAEKNYLPYDGTVNYFGKIVSEIEAQKFYLNLLNEIEWKNDEAIIFGKLIYTKRKVAWYAEDAFEYTYSKRTRSALKFTNDLLFLKNLVEEKTAETYNSCLLNLYHSGEEGMAYHSDGEKDLKENGAIASLSFGAKRKFSFKHKITKERVDFNLEPGSLLVMKGETQKNWLHRLPPTKLVKTPRINLTFRSIEK